MELLEIKREDKLVCTYDPETWKFEPAPKKKTETEFLKRLHKRVGTQEPSVGYYYDLTDFPELKDPFDVAHLLGFVLILESEGYEAYYKGKRLELKLVDEGDIFFD